MTRAHRWADDGETTRFTCDMGDAMTISTHRDVGIDVLSLITRISPHAWKVITSTDVVRNGTEEVELQPQPLPPVERLQVYAAMMTHRLVQLALESEIQGRAGSQIVSEMVDDWCGTPPWPRRWPHLEPTPSPEPGPRPDEGPVPDPWVTQTGRMVGALVLANIGGRLASGELRDTLLTGAQRLSDAAMLH